MVGVKQLLLRVPEDLHRRLALRAGREGRSMNAVATEILSAIPDSEQADRRARLRAAAAASGMLRTTAPARVSASQRARVLRTTRGLGKHVDQLLSDERDRV